MNIDDWLQKWVADLEQAAPSPQPPLKKIAIISTPRSGSKYFCDALASCGRFGKPDEWFHLPMFRVFRSRHKEQFVDFQTYLNFVISRTTSDNGVFAVNFHINQYLEWRKHGIDLIDIGYDHVICVRRSDKLSQAYSLAKAMYTGQWNSAMAPKRQAMPSEISNVMILQALGLIGQWDDFYERELSARVDSSYVYEDFCQDQTVFPLVMRECGIACDGTEEFRVGIEVQRRPDDIARIESLRRYLGIDCSRVREPG